MNAPRIASDLLGPEGRGVLDRLLPMHVHVGPEGTILHAGPAFAKTCAGVPVLGRPFQEVLSIRRPSPATSMAALRALEGQRLTLAVAEAPDLPLRGVVANLPAGRGCLLDVSLGLSFQTAVSRFDLTISDFSPCDQTVELLYLHEAKEAIFRLSRKLSDRLAAARAAAEVQAHTDPLTGLSNRRAFEAALARQLADRACVLTLMHIDLDHFKQVNDTRGHAAGDAVLRVVGDILRRDLRAGDMAVRIGGDEFLLLLPGGTCPTALATIAERLIRRIERPIAVEDAAVRISASIGIASTMDYADRPDAARLMADADAALYAAKDRGRAGFAVHGADAIAARPGRGASRPP